MRKPIANSNRPHRWQPVKGYWSCVCSWIPALASRYTAPNITPLHAEEVLHTQWRGCCGRRPWPEWSSGPMSPTRTAGLTRQLFKQTLSAGLGDFPQIFGHLCSLLNIIWHTTNFLLLQKYASSHKKQTFHNLQHSITYFSFRDNYFKKETSHLFQKPALSYMRRLSAHCTPAPMGFNEVDHCHYSLKVPSHGVPSC